MSPAQLVNEHPITRRLKALGLTEEQLLAIRFKTTNQDCPFDQWSFTWADGTPPGGIPLFKSYCALKWLMLEAPPASRDKDDAWREIALIEAAPTFEIGERTKAAQQKRAQKPRGKIDDKGTTICQLVETLALKAEYRALSTKELWPHFSPLLEEHGLAPKETSHSTDLKKLGYEYEVLGKKKRISFGSFANAVSKARNKKSQ